MNQNKAIEQILEDLVTKKKSAVLLGIEDEPTIHLIIEGQTEHVEAVKLPGAEHFFTNDSMKNLLPEYVESMYLGAEDWYKTHVSRKISLLAVVMTSEAWMSSYGEADCPNGELPLGAKRPSEDPNRKEAIIISVSKESYSLMRTIHIERKPEGIEFGEDTGFVETGGGKLASLYPKRVVSS